MKKIFLLFMGLVLFSDYAFAYEEIDLKRGVFFESRFSKSDSY